MYGRKRFAFAMLLLSIIAFTPEAIVLHAEPRHQWVCRDRSSNRVDAVPNEPIESTTTGMHSVISSMIPMSGGYPTRLVRVKSTMENQPIKTATPAQIEAENERKEDPL